MKNAKLMITALACAMVLSIAALAGCAQQSAAPSGDSGAAGTTETPAATETPDAGNDATAEETPAAEEPAATPSVSTASVQIDADAINEYCGMCHFQNVENMAINSWNRDTINFGIVESMTPFLDDATIQGIVDYYAEIEPPAQEGGMH